jgi:hypothetical protein
MSRERDDIAIELLDEPDALDQIAPGSLTMAITSEADSVVLRIGYALDNSFTADPRLPELTFASVDALALAAALCRAAATAAHDADDGQKGRMN